MRGPRLPRSATPAAPKAPLPAPTETHTVLIKNLVRDPGFQVRSRLDDATVSRYANVIAEGCTMPPIRVALVNGALVVVDGHHRLAAHEQRGALEIEAEIIKASADEAQWLAAVANMAHGLPLRGKEIRTVFRAMLKARKHLAKPTTGAMMPGKLLSYRELAALMGGVVRHTSLHKWMREDFPDIARRMADAGTGEASRENRRDDTSVFYNTVMASIATASANAAGVREAEARGTMIKAVEGLLEGIRKGGGFTLETFTEF